jgi:hypothetical protein
LKIFTFKNCKRKAIENFYFKNIPGGKQLDFQKIEPRGVHLKFLIKKIDRGKQLT